ncbi:hypothetical protein LZ30DRAFT_734052 [Colletotrichum cereale]|nr:hypothetical protein LZ30DRAFT_734052 [Colletotrichum cereale]
MDVCTPGQCIRACWLLLLFAPSLNLAQVLLQTHHKHTHPAARWAATLLASDSMRCNAAASAALQGVAGQGWGPARTTTTTRGGDGGRGQG